MTTHSIEDCRQIVELDTQVNRLTSDIREVEQLPKDDVVTLYNYQGPYNCWDWRPRVSFKIDRPTLLKAMYSRREKLRNELLDLQNA